VRPLAALAAAVLLGLAAAAAAAGPQLLPAAPAEEPAGPAPGSVAAEAGPEEDAAIERRLEAIFATAGDLEGVTVEVESGVVRLGGEALSVNDAARAVRLARSLAGVVDVVDDVAVVRDVRRRLAPALSTLREGADALIGLLPLLGVAAALVALFGLLARWLARWDWLFDRLSRNPFAGDWMRRGARAAVTLVGVVLALELLGATALVGAVLGAAGLAGLALGFAFRDTVENYIAGILLSLRQPFVPNDLVEIEGREGKVIRLTPRATVLMTLDGNHVRIPNAIVFKGIMVNYTRNPRRRFRVEVGVGTDVDLAAALDLGLATLGRLDGVLAEPAPAAWIERLGDSSVAIVVAGWVDQRVHDFAKVRSEGIRAVKEAFDAAGFDMPEPIYRVVLRGTPPAGEPAVAPGAPSAEPAEERARPTPALPPEQAAAAAGPQRDTSPNVDIDHEVAADRAAAPGEDLLDPAAPKE
jgi:small-conductance mechanosensitive channel